MKRSNIVVLGGGTGLSVLLRGLKTFPVDITAIVTVADDGGSSGRLRKEMNIPPPGDVRNVLVALAEVEPMIEQLFQHRFTTGEGLVGHSLGNLLLAGMTSITGDFAKGISELSTVLNVRGKVLPSSNQSVVLHAKMMDGTTVEGESTIPRAEKQIRHVFLRPEGVKALPESLKAIEEADLIVLGPGSLYTSILPNLLVPGIIEAIQDSKAKKVYICNVMTQKGETDNFTASDHVQAIFNHTHEQFIETVLVNNGVIPDELIKKYQQEDAYPVPFDEEKMRAFGCRVVKDEFIRYDGMVLRHNAVKVAQSLLMEL